MVENQTFKEMALSFPQTEEKPHFHLSSFRWKNKIFATLHVEERRAMLKLTPVDQSVFCDLDRAFYPVDGGWGKKGATFVDLKKVGKKMFKDALTLAYEGVSKKTVKTKKPVP